MKHLIIIILVCAVGYLLYDKFTSGNGEAVSSLKPAFQSWTSSSSEDTSDPFENQPVVRQNVKNKSLAKMEHPETMTDEERRLAEGWENSKPRYFSDLDQMKSAYRKKAKVPYRYNERYADKLKTAIIELENAINYDDFLVVPERCDIAKDALRRFESSCSWQSGVSRGNGTHMHSGYQEGSWLPDNGYTMMNRGGEMVAVQVFTCRDCRGMGYHIQKATCPNCNGRGRVANPMSQVGDAVNLIGGFMGGKGGRRQIRVPKQQSEITCSACNRGKVEQRVQCPSCNGQGKIYR